MKYLIIGGVAGGATIAARLRRNDENAEIILFEKGEYISYANCGLPYYIGDVIKDRDKLLVQTVSAFSKRYRIDIRTMSEVISIEPVSKAIEVLNIRNGERYNERYDKLILSPGAVPITPPIPGIKSKNIFTLRNITDTDNVKSYIATNPVNKAVVVGGGFIGLEMAENLHHLGIKVSIVEKAEYLMSMLDSSMSAIIHSELKLNGIDLYLNKSVQSFDKKGGETRVILEGGEIIETDLVIWSIGVKPETSLAKEAGLEIGKSGGIKVNEYLQTSNIDIYAVGDAIEVLNPVINKPMLLPLAGPANKQARIAADNIVFGNRSVYGGTIGTGIVKIFDITVGFTGLSNKALDLHEIENTTSFTHSFSNATYYPGAAPISIKISFSPFDGRLYGAQVVGSAGVDKRLDLFAKVIKSKGSIRDLTDFEHAYAPPFSSAKDPVNMAGFVAENILSGRVKVVQWYDIKNIDPLKDYIIDVRTAEEYAIGAIDGSINIPVDEIRERLEVIPSDKRIIVYCAIGLRGYIAYRILTQNGFQSVFNLSGGYKTYSMATEKIVFSEYCRISKSCNDQEGIDSSELAKCIDAVGLQCPGPIMKLKEEYDKIERGESVTIRANDPSFAKDVESWCNVTGATLEKIETNRGVVTAVISKIDVREEISDSDIEERLSNNKTMIVFSGDLDKVIASFIIANGAAAMGKKVTMFFTFWGLNAIKRESATEVKRDLFGKAFAFMLPKNSTALPLSKMNMMGAGKKMMRYIMKKKNIDSLEHLIEQAQKNNIEMIACTMSMDVMGISREEIIDGVKFAGVATFIEKSDKANMAMFI